MNILLVSHSSEIGGAELAIINTLKFWTTKHDVKPHFILPARGKLLNLIKENGWEYSVVSYGVWAWPVVPKKSEDVYRERVRNLLSVRKILSIIKEQKPEFVLTNTVVSPWGALAAGMVGVPHVWYVHEYGDLDHGLVFEMGRERTLQDIDFLSDFVIANSRAIEKHLAKYINPEKIHTSYLPFDVQHIQNELATATGKQYFDRSKGLGLYITGRITPSKGQFDAVKAVAILHKRNIPVQLCLVGAVEDEDYLRDIMTFAKKEGVETSILLPGYVTQPFALINSADICLTPSRLEAFGQTTFEYMLLGKPVIGTNSGGTIEMVRDGQNGFLYTYEHPEELADHIAIYANNPELIKEHGDKSRILAEKMLKGSHSPDVLLERILAAIKGKQTLKLPNFTEEIFEFSKVMETYHKRLSPPTLKSRTKWVVKGVYRRSPGPVRHIAKKVYRKYRPAKPPKKLSKAKDEQ